MKRLMVINVVGLAPGHIGPQTPHLERLAREGFSRPLGTILPAVTCSVQATFLTGRPPREHGIVGNGWYFHDLSEILFWRQANALIQSEKVYEAARRRDPRHTTAKMFWWYNMYASVACAVTPRPSYPSDGRKLPDIYSDPASLRDDLQQKLGPFPLFKFWGPGAEISSTRWIADASVQVWHEFQPSLMLVYLPHLDYNLQRVGPHDPKIAEDLRLVDAEAGKLMAAARASDAEIVVLSEYAITAVEQPVHLNRVLRDHGWLRTRRETLGWETLDAGASKAFAVADHQVAHVYVRSPQQVAEVGAVLRRTPGVERVLDRAQQAEFGIDHARAGDLVCVAAPGAWFTYYFWTDDRVAPDYARTVDIHRKPGYDPVELFLDPKLRWPMGRIAWRLLQKKLGFRYYLDVIGLDASIIRGSHGRLPRLGREADEGPVWISSSRAIERDTIEATEVKDLLLRLQFGE